MVASVHDNSRLTSFPAGGLAAVVGASGAIGDALLERLRGDGGFAEVLGLSRSEVPPIDLISEASVASTARHIAERAIALRLVVDASGFLHGDGFMPEKSWRQLEPAHMAKAFAVNAIGPALLMKHFLPLRPSLRRLISLRA
jgi:NAD(P)-dependent dehydrogenase (short-subunit alcohol dehydrogenase family)